MRLILIEAGEFEMAMLDKHRLQLHHGSSAYQREIHDYVEQPSFPVRLTRDLDMAATEVTVGQFRQFVEVTGYETDAERSGDAWALQPDAERPLDQFAKQKGRPWKDPGFPQSDDHPESRCENEYQPAA